MSRKSKLIEQLAEDALIDTELAKNSDEEDEVMDNFMDDVFSVMSFRYGYIAVVPRSRNWIDQILPRLDDYRFKKMLRVTRAQFDIILNLIKDDSVFKGENSCHQFTSSAQLSITLFRMGIYGSGASASKVSALFGIGDGGTVHRITKRVIQAILNHRKDYIYWPDQNERQAIVDKTMTELPRCIGYLDGTEVHLNETPNLDHTSYYSRKQRYGLKVQAICDHTLKIRHLVVGYPGSVHDSRIFANCTIGRNPELHFSDNQWVAADSAYALTDTVITPFRSNSSAGSASKRRKFNKYFSGYRVRIEHCFGVLKEKFSSLKELRIRIKDTESHEFACNWITCVCILHNLLLPYFDSEDLNVSYDEDQDQVTNNVHDDKQGEIKRKAIYRAIFGENL